MTTTRLRSERPRIANGDLVTHRRIERGVYPSSGAHRVDPDTWKKSADELRQGKARYVLLTKLHGSLNWVREEDGIVAGAWTQPPRDLAAAGIVYPELEKDASSEFPFKVFYDRMEASLRQASIVVSVGYAHRDPAVEKRLLGARSTPLIVVNPQPGLDDVLRDQGHDSVTQIAAGFTHVSGKTILERIGSSG